MGKRSNFERVPRDLYPTPMAAVRPLIPYLRRDGVKTFAELCAGNDDLIRHLKSFGIRCVHRGDIASGQDALKVKRYIDSPDAGITNPPFTDPNGPERNTNLLHDLIRHFLDLGVPFYLLLPHDFAANKGSAPFLKYCTDIIVVGRVKWIPDSEFTGKDNSCWYRFDINHRGSIAFHNDRGEPVSIEQTPLTSDRSIITALRRPSSCV